MTAPGRISLRHLIPYGLQGYNRHYTRTINYVVPRSLRVTYDILVVPTSDLSDSLTVTSSMQPLYYHNAWSILCHDKKTSKLTLI